MHIVIVIFKMKTMILILKNPKISSSQQEEDQNMSSSSQNESLILPHTGTLYNGTSKI